MDLTSTGACLLSRDTCRSDCRRVYINTSRQWKLESSRLRIDITIWIGSFSLFLSLLLLLVGTYLDPWWRWDWAAPSCLAGCPCHCRVAVPCRGVTIPAAAVAAGPAGSWLKRSSASWRFFAQSCHLFTHTLAARQSRDTTAVPSFPW